MSRFVRPDTCTLTISNGDWLLVRRQLTAGETRAQFARMYQAGVDGTLQLNPMATGLAVITAYLIDWSLTDDDGHTVPIRGLGPTDLEAILDTLDQDSFREINRAIDVHAADMHAARADAKKKTNFGAIGSSPISPSPDAATGDTNGSPISIPTSMRS